MITVSDRKEQKERTKMNQVGQCQGKLPATTQLQLIFSTRKHKAEYT